MLWIRKRQIFLKVDIDYQNKRCENEILRDKTDSYEQLQNLTECFFNLTRLNKPSLTSALKEITNHLVETSQPP